MAILEQVPSEVDMMPQSQTSNPLNAILARAYTLNWEVAFYVVLLVIAVLTRFIGLGDRVMSHDESLHVKYSHELMLNGNFQHTPLMHGPVLFHMTALNFFLFGDSDFSGRLYPAILGIIMIFMPKLLFERWLGKLGAAAAGIFITISPMLLYHHRYIREDTPAIFYTILMVYAMFAYIDGAVERKGKTWLLLLFSGATLLNLATKETAFMYIGIFGFILTAFILFQLAQTWRRGELPPVIGQSVLGLVTLPVLGVVVSLVLAASRLGSAVPVLAPGENGLLGLNANLQQLVGQIAWWSLIGVPAALFASVGVFFVIRLIWGVFRRPLNGLVGWTGKEAKSLFAMLLAGMIIGTVASMGFTLVLSITQPDPERLATAGQQWSNYDAAVAAVQPGQPAPTAPSDLRPAETWFRVVSWGGVVIVILLAALLLPMLGRFSRMPRLPFRDVILIALVAVIWGTAIVIAEERSRHVPNVSTEARPVVTDYDNEWIAGAWVVSLVAVAGIIVLKTRTKFFEEMSKYPAFDLTLVLGALVLPWLSAIPIFLAHYQLDLSSYPDETIRVMIIATVPFFLVSFALGLAWNWSKWLACFGVFYGLFLFFFTTMLTNPQGIGTGLVGSLGYWMAQQGVRRGSQPQYYYLLIQMPIYEYLLILGSSFAGVMGISGLWQWRAQRIRDDREAAELAANVESDMNSAVEAVNVDDPASAELHERSENLVEAEVTAPRTVPGQGSVPEAENLTAIPFLGFMGYWATLIIMALTFAGEKMPWLTTHIALPLAIIAGWYLGKLLESVDWQLFLQRTWAALLLIPVFLVGVGSLIFRDSGAAGISSLQRNELLAFGQLGGAVLLTIIVGIALYRIWKWVGTTQFLRVAVLGLFLVVGVLTARTAFLATYINYDQANEFLVYAHGGPANKTVINYLEDISRRTTDGMSIRVAYDNQMSWPGSWYFRNFPNATFLGDASGATGLDQYVAIAVGTENAQKIEPDLGDNYEKFDLIRLWWPMQDYFDLNIRRVENAASDPKMRAALWDIWLNRDYRKFSEATTGDKDRYNLNQWPVVDRMIFYVRKDVAAKVWDFGVGAKVSAPLQADPFAQLRCDTCGAAAELSAVTQMLNPPNLNSPRGIATDGKGNVYLADMRNGRIVVYDSAGKIARSFGVLSTVDANANPPAGSFREPWGIAVDKEGLIYVADTWNHRIQVFSNDGQPVRKWGQFEQAAADTPGKTDGFYGPRDVKVDSVGNVYVADTGNRRIRVYDSLGNFQRDLGSGANLREPVGLAINEAANEIYVASTWSQKIVVLSTVDGQLLREWSVRAWAASKPEKDSGNRPYLTLDKTGRYLLVTDPDTARILVYDTVGTPVLSFGRLGAPPYTLNAFGVLGGITMDPSSGQLYLTDAAAGRVLRLDPQTLPGLSLSVAEPLANPVGADVISTQEVTPVK